MAQKVPSQPGGAFSFGHPKRTNLQHLSPTQDKKFSSEACTQPPLKGTWVPKAGSKDLPHYGAEGRTLCPPKLHRSHRCWQGWLISSIL